MILKNNILGVRKVYVRNLRLGREKLRGWNGIRIGMRDEEEGIVLGDYG